MAEFTEELTTDEWEVETPTGWQSFSGIGKTIPYKMWVLKTLNLTLRCADRHIVYRINPHTNSIEETFVEELHTGDIIQSKFGYEVVTSVKETDEIVPMFDLTDVDGGNVYYTNNILSHNSTTVISYVLHYLLFNENVNVAILAHKQEIARELLGKLKTAYEYLPKWMQHGILEWNKGSVVLENGSKVKASATSSSAIRGGSYNCISTDSIITIRNPQTDEVFDASIGEFYANSSRNTNNHTYEYGNDRKQIQEVVLFPYGEGAKSCYGRYSHHRKTPHNPQVLGGKQQQNEYSSADNTGTFISTSASSTLFRWCGEGKDVPCISQNGSWTTGKSGQIISKCLVGSKQELFRSETIDENWNKTQRSNQKENSSRPQRQDIIGRIEAKNINGKQRSVCGKGNAKGVWGEYIQNAYGDKEDQGTLRQNQQESRENSKDGRKASWDETISRNEGSDECGGQRKNRTSRWALEQGEEDGRWEILTHNGFKKFHGLSKAPNQKTIKVKLDNDKEIVCTPDHKIFSVSRGSVVAESLCVGEIVEGDHGSVGVAGVEECGVRDVYDLLEVEDHHSYYANGIRISNCVVLDEFAYVPQNIAEEFYSSAFPTISTGSDTKIMIFSTPNGLNMFYKIWTDAEEKRSSFVPISVHWSDLPGRDEKWRKQQIANSSESQFRQEYGCDFIGSTNTLIEATKLRSMAYKTPVSRTDQGMAIYKHPIAEHAYVMVVDTSRGVGLDYHAFVVIDITQMPYEVVATFKNNDMSPMIYPNIIYPIATRYNSAYLLVETNDIGGQVADILHNDLEYDNMLMSSFRGRRGQVMDGGFGASQTNLGVRTTKPVKRLGCSILKTMIEDDKLLITDFNIIQELVSFAVKSNSYEAEAGHHDDLVMCLVLFAWVTTQGYFKDLTNMDIRQNIFDSKLREIEDAICPVGFIENGQEDDEETDDQGNVWRSN